MKREERGVELDEAILQAFPGLQAGIWTALPCEVTKVEISSNKRTVNCQPLIQARITQQDGTYQWVNLPMLLDCPVVFQEGGNFSLTFPIAIGDEALVVFSSRCIDAWWQQGGIQPQADIRMHDLSDGFAIVGVRSQTNAMPNISTSNVQLRSVDGSTYLELSPAGAINMVTAGNISMTCGGTATITAAGGANINGVTIDPSGNLVSPGDISDHGTKSMSGMRTVFNNHVHHENGVGNNTNPTNTPM